MPAIIPFIPLIAAGISAGVPLVEHAVEGDPTAGLMKQLQEQQAKSKAQQDLQTKEAALTQAPNIQTQLGGAVAPDYFIAETARESGSSGQENIVRQALQGFLGLSSGSGGESPAAPGFGLSPTTTGTSGERGGPGSGPSGGGSLDEILRLFSPGGGGGAGGSSGGSTETGTSGGYL